MTAKPRMQALIDWRDTGSFAPDRFEGEARKQYEDEAARILRQWDNQPR